MKDALIGIGDLLKLAGKYEQTAKMLRSVARGLGGVMDSFGQQPAAEKSRKRKQMSPAARRKLSQAMKLRWQEKKRVANARPLRRTPVGEAPAA